MRFHAASTTANGRRYTVIAISKEDAGRLASGSMVTCPLQFGSGPDEPGQLILTTYENEREGEEMVALLNATLHAALESEKRALTEPEKGFVRWLVRAELDKWAREQKPEGPA